MNILSISGILPVPGIQKANDFLIPLFKTYKNKFPDDRICFIKPFPFKPTLKSSRQLLRLKEYDLDGLRVVLIPYFSAWRLASLHSLLASLTAYFLNRKRIRQLVKEWQIDIVHAEYVIPDGYIARMILKDIGIRYVVTVHDENRYLDSFISKKVFTKILSEASWITPLNYPSALLYRKIVKTNIDVIPHGIDTRFLKPLPGHGPRTEIKVLTIAALLAYKNIDKVIIALGRLKNDFQFKYTIIGKGPERKRLAELVTELGLESRVEFIEMIPYDQVPSEMCKYDLFILPSYFETFGRVLFEAMAVGLPVICARDSGIHGYFTEGDQALSVQHDHMEDIVEKLRMLMLDAGLRQDMGLKAKELMHNYTWENIVTTLHDIYVKVLKKS